MRLLDCDVVTCRLPLRTFYGTDEPAYAILSHRWTDDGVLFRGIEGNTSMNRAGYFNSKRAYKFGTYMDLLIKFRRETDSTCVFVVIGIVDAKELAFFAGAGDPGCVDQQFYPGRSSEVALNGAFKKLALSIGSSLDLGILHCVSVRQSPVESTGNDLDDQIRRPRIEITALNVPRAEPEFRPRDSCCSVQ